MTDNQQMNGGQNDIVLCKVVLTKCYLIWIFIILIIFIIAANTLVLSIYITRKKIKQTWSGSQDIHYSLYPPIYAVISLSFSVSSSHSRHVKRCEHADIVRRNFWELQKFFDCGRLCTFIFRRKLISCGNVCWNM